MPHDSPTFAACLSPPAGERRARLPDRLRLLFVTPLGYPSQWLADVFATDRACHVAIATAQGQAQSLERLRQETFDVVLVVHDVAQLDALNLTEALRTGGHDDALLLIGRASAVELEAPAWEAGADGYCCIETTTARSLLWLCARAVAQQQQRSELRRLREADRQRLTREHAEAEHLLDQQRSLLAELTGLTPPRELAIARDPSQRGPAHDIVKRYSEILRSHVMMGSGNVAGEIAALAGDLVAGELSAHAAMQMHVDAVQQLVAGLGSRSARHVMTRADLLLVELVAHLADAYRERYNGSRDASGELRPAA